MINQFLEISVNDTKLSPNWRKDNFGRNTQIIPIFGATWVFNNIKIIKKYSYNTCLKVIPDGSAVVAIERKNDELCYGNELVFFEADGEERFRIKSPTPFELSTPQKAFFYFLTFMGDGACNCVFNDGDDDYMGKLNIENGSISDIKRTRV